MKRVLGIILFVFAYSLSASAQISLPDKVSVFLPNYLKSRLIEEHKLSEISKEKNYGQSNHTNGDKKFWDVFSDRSNNPAYNRPDKSSGVACKLKFNQKLRIAKIEKDFALVYEEPNTRLAYPNVSSDAKAKGALGWVPMDKLLLWHSSLANEYGILNKALLVYNLNKKNDLNNFQRYQNPETKDGATNLDYDVNFYFVMKRSANGLVLLARESSMEGNTDQVLYGWVNEGSYTPWNQRSCLEFNWKYRDFEEGLDGDSVGFFADKDFKEIAANYHKYNISEVGSIGKEKRIPGSILRLPILDKETDNNDMYHITYFAPANGEMSYDEAAKIQEQSQIAMNQTIENIKNLNLIIVVDGTASMEPYFNTLYKTVKESCEQYIDQKYKVKLGLVIYRDYKDVLNGDSCYVETVPMTQMNDSKLFECFENGGKYGIRSRKDDDYCEALYEGLYAALDTNRMKYSKKESNLIIVIGDCGNRNNDHRSPSIEKIKEMIYANNVSLISFQVHNKDVNSDAWIYFNDQMNDLILSNIEYLYKEAGLRGEFVTNEDGTGSDYRVDEGRSFYVASMRSPNLGESMPIDELKKLINDNILTFSQAIGEQINAVSNSFSNFRSTLASGSQRFDKGFLKSRLGEKNITLFEKRSMLLALNGFTPKKNKKGVEYYKPVIFIEHGEFETLLARFREVYDATAKNDTRENYINAMKQLLKNMAPGMGDNEFNKLGSAHIRKMISGLNESTDGLNRSFEEIGDVNAVSDMEFKRILQNFKIKYQTLQRIHERVYEYTFKSNNHTYYWIPFDDLP